MTWERTAPALAEIHGSASNRQLSFYLYTDEDSQSGWIDLNAPYQRGDVWTYDQRQALIRSFIQGIVPAAVYLSLVDLYTEGPFSYRAIDGKQRIQTVRMFAAGDLAVPADWFPDADLGDVPDDGMVTMLNLSGRGRRGFESSTMPTVEVDLTGEKIRVPGGTGTTGSDRQYVNRRRTPHEVLVAEAEVYLLLNTAGTAHTAEELASATTITGVT